MNEWKKIWKVINWINCTQISRVFEFWIFPNNALHFAYLRCNWNFAVSYCKFSTTRTTLSVQRLRIIESLHAIATTFGHWEKITNKCAYRWPISTHATWIRAPSALQSKRVSYAIHLFAAPTRTKCSLLWVLENRESNRRLENENRRRLSRNKTFIIQIVFYSILIHSPCDLQICCALS